MFVQQLFDDSTGAYTYLLADPSTREAVIIDPVAGRAHRDLQLIRAQGFELLYILETPIRPRPGSGAAALRRATGAIRVVGSAAGICDFDRVLRRRDVIHFGTQALEARMLRGVNIACVTYVARLNEGSVAFTGDALLSGDPASPDPIWGTAPRWPMAVRTQILGLARNTLIYPGHGEHARFVTTVAAVKEQSFPAAPRAMKVPSGEDAEDPASSQEQEVTVDCNLGCNFRADQGDVTVEQRSARRLAFDPGAVVIDLRSSEEFVGDASRLRSAVSIPFAELERRVVSWPRDVPIVVVCERRVRAAQGCSVLLGMGFRRVSNLEGGMMALRRRGQETAQ